MKKKMGGSVNPALFPLEQTDFDDFGVWHWVWWGSHLPSARLPVSAIQIAPVVSGSSREVQGTSRTSPCLKTGPLRIRNNWVDTPTVQELPEE